MRCFLRISPCLRLIKIAGILIPAPVPSSESINEDTFSFLESMMIASDPPARSMFLVYVTYEHLEEDSTIKIGERTSSGSPEKSSVNLEPAWHPFGFEELK